MAVSHIGSDVSNAIGKESCDEVHEPDSGKGILYLEVAGRVNVKR